MNDPLKDHLSAVRHHLAPLLSSGLLRGTTVKWSEQRNGTVHTSIFTVDVWNQERCDTVSSRTFPVRLGKPNQLILRTERSVMYSARFADPMTVIRLIGKTEVPNRPDLHSAAEPGSIELLALVLNTVAQRKDDETCSGLMVSLSRTGRPDFSGVSFETQMTLAYLPSRSKRWLHYHKTSRNTALKTGNVLFSVGIPLGLTGELTGPGPVRADDLHCKTFHETAELFRDLQHRKNEDELSITADFQIDDDRGGRLAYSNGTVSQEAISPVRLKEASETRRWARQKHADHPAGSADAFSRVEFTAEQGRAFWTAEAFRQPVHGELCLVLSVFLSKWQAGAQTSLEWKQEREAERLTFTPLSRTEVLVWIRDARLVVNVSAVLQIAPTLRVVMEAARTYLQSSLQERPAAPGAV